MPALPVPLLLLPALLLAFLLPGSLVFSPVQADQQVRPEWIWATQNRNHPQAVELRSPLHIDGTVQRADLRLATEFTGCELRFGGRTAFVLDDYGPWLDLDVTDHVRAGDDVLELHCTGSQGPSAIAFDETRPSWVVSAMLSLARSEHEEFIPRILQKLLEVPYESLSGNDRSMLLETWSRCLSHPAAAKAPGYTATVERIRTWYPDLGPPVFAPTGAGRSVNRQLALLAQQLQIPDLVPKTLILLARAHTPQQRLHAVFVLRNCRTGWTPESRQTVFETLGTLDRTVIGGEGMPGFLRRIREELIGTLTESERLALGDLLQSGVEAEQPPLIIDRPVVKKWQSDDLDTLLADNATPPNHEHGRELFRIALCSHCHRTGSTGGVVGPDLTSVARRFGRRDLLLSILEPSRVVDEKYRHEQIVTTDGRVIIGRLVTGGDYRATKLRLATDPLRPGQMVEIDKNDIETHQPSLQSPMPNGLLDTLSASDIRDLLAYLEHMAVFERR